MAATHNITVPEEYQSNGETKTRWNNIGVIIVTEKDGKKRTSIKLNSLPIGWDGYANVYPIDKDRDNSRRDNRRDATQDDHNDASDDMNQGQHTSDSLNPDDQPIDLSEIPF